MDIASGETRPPEEMRPYIEEHFGFLEAVPHQQIVLLAPEPNSSFKNRLYEVLACYRDQLGVSSFNLALNLPPLAPTPESWEGFPVVARLVDRGELGAKASNMGAMELYAQSVVAADPFEVARALQEVLT